MKVRLTWTTTLGLMPVLILGCGSTDNPIREETPEPPTEPRIETVSPVLGDWRLLEIIWLKVGVLTHHIDSGGWFYGANPNILTFAPDGVFDLTNRYPIEEVASLDWLEWLGLEHVQEIVVTHRGKYHIGVNQLRLNLIVTRVEPKEEGPEIRRDLENPVFLYDFSFNDGVPLDYILTDDGNQLELRREEGEYMVKFLHRRPKTDLNMGLADEN